MNFLLKDHHFTRPVESIERLSGNFVIIYLKSTFPSGPETVVLTPDEALFFIATLCSTFKINHHALNLKSKPDDENNEDTEP